MTDYMKRFRLDKKTAVVCGGLGLIGREVSIAFGQAGAKVLVLDIDENKGKAFEKECKAQKIDVRFIKFDVTCIKDYPSEIKKIVKENGMIDVWVNTAYPRTKDWANKLEDVSVESWTENVETQMNSYCLLTRELAELMKKNKVKGSIINYGSTYGVVGPDFEIYSGTEMTMPAAYAAIKGGIVNFSRYAASYYGKYGIRVNCLCPGGIFNSQNPGFVKEYNKKTPLKRMGNPDEIAAATLFLASDAASYITGATFMVDGGWTSI